VCWYIKISRCGEVGMQYYKIVTAGRYFDYGLRNNVEVYNTYSLNFQYLKTNQRERF